MADKMLDRVSKLLNQAENAGTPEEAATFMEKVQELASLNNIDLALARMHQAKKERVQVPEERRIQVNPNNRRNNRKHFMELAMAIADVNDVEYLISGRETALLAVGFPSDLDVVEALFTHLSVQMVTECDEALARGDHKEIKKVCKTKKELIPEEDRDWGGWDSVNNRWYDTEYHEKGEMVYNYDTRRYRVTHQPPKYREVDVLDDDGNPIFEEKEVIVTNGKIFRSNFYAGFIPRMRGRLWEIKKATERHAGAEEATSETAIALRDKRKDVQEAAEEQRAGIKFLGHYKSSEETMKNFAGNAIDAGVKSAERVPVDGNREVKN